MLSGSQCIGQHEHWGPRVEGAEDNFGGTKWEDVWLSGNHHISLREQSRHRRTLFKCCQHGRQTLYAVSEGQQTFPRKVSYHILATSLTDKTGYLSRARRETAHKVLRGEYFKHHIKNVHIAKEFIS